MRQGVEEDVDAHGIGVRGEAQEIFSVLSLAFPAIWNVVVVNHHDHDPPFVVDDSARALAARREAAFRYGPAASPPRLDGRHLRKMFELELRMPDGMVHRQIDDRIFLVWQGAADLLVELVFRERAPMVK